MRGWRAGAGRLSEMKEGCGNGREQLPAAAAATSPHTTTATTHPSPPAPPLPPPATTTFPTQHPQHPQHPPTHVTLRRVFHSASYSSANCAVPHDTPRHRMSVPAMARGAVAGSLAASASAGQARARQREGAREKGGGIKEPTCCQAGQGRQAASRKQPDAASQQPAAGRPSQRTQHINDVARRGCHRGVAAILALHPRHLRVAPGRQARQQVRHLLSCACGAGSHSAGQPGPTGCRSPQGASPNTGRPPPPAASVPQAAPLRACRRATRCRAAPAGSCRTPQVCPPPAAERLSHAPARPPCTHKQRWGEVVRPATPPALPPWPCCAAPHLVHSCTRLGKRPQGREYE